MLVSFIIPVYNVERYLPTCLDSILSQGLESEDFEIILVEDKSTDDSLRICQDFCLKYNNITLIENEKNLGPGLSRNKGIIASKGKYIHFVDSDDFLLQDSLRDLLSLNVISDSPDVIQFNSSDKTNRTTTVNRVIYKGRCNDSSSLNPPLSAWHYWYRRQFLLENGFSFVDKKTGQDTFFTFSVLSCNPFIVAVSTVVYFYRHNNNSITSHTDISYVQCLIEIADDIREKSDCSKLSSFYLSEIYKDIISRFYNSHRSWQECKEFKKKMHTFDQYSIITNGPWYLQLSRMPLLLYLYLLLKRNKNLSN